MLKPIRLVLLVSVVAFLAYPAGSEINISKDNYRFPLKRTYIFNPISVSNPCERKEFRVTHRRDADGKPYDIDVTPVNGMDISLVPAVLESFQNWRFPVPVREDWKEEYLSVEHENKFWSEPPCDCLSKSEDRYKLRCE